MTFCYQGEAEDVRLIGGLQRRLLRLPGTDVWAITLRIADLDRAVFSYALSPGGWGPNQPFYTWRGPDAPARPERRIDLLGQVVQTTLPSAHLTAPRGISVYLPPGHREDHVYPVVYLADGKSVRGYAQALEPLFDAGLPNIVLIGVHNAGNSDDRNAEYVPGFDPSTSNGHWVVLKPDHTEAFERHRRFWIEEVLPWAEATHGANADREVRVVFGCSSGCRFAVEMGLRHPNHFGRVIGFSLGFVPHEPRFAGPPPAHYLLGGTLESFHDTTKTYAALLRERRVPCVFREPVGGHDFALWSDAFPDAMRWAFGREDIEQQPDTA